MSRALEWVTRFPGVTWATIAVGMIGLVMCLFWVVSPHGGGATSCWPPVDASCPLPSPTSTRPALPYESPGTSR